MTRKKSEAAIYVDNRFQNYDLRSLCKGNSKISVFPLSPLAKLSQALLWRITKLTASQIPNTEPSTVLENGSNHKPKVLQS